ncbi:MAG: LuxR C-terminal-related transcriptional regulator [Bacteroidales bacterium]|jgi:DNA-binding NarL/FixJ family response regulator|nr:LuxR C-terminal-related transcriptional regulator [Bacteroidales bacterium]
MNNDFISIGIAEPSDIIYDGLSNILHKSGINVRLFKIDSIDGFDEKMNTDVVIINPVLILNKTKEFKKIRKVFHNIHWVGLVYSLFSNDTLSLFDDIISINDPCEAIYKVIGKFGDEHPDEKVSKQQEQLSERETDVLVQLVSGLSNKEIADKLNISTHTVISHRKNISLKTGIKSQSGLTIYALTKNIISLDKLA